MIYRTELHVLTIMLLHSYKKNQSGIHITQFKQSWVRKKIPNLNFILRGLQQPKKALNRYFQKILDGSPPKERDWIAMMMDQDPLHLRTIHLCVLTCLPYELDHIGDWRLIGTQEVAVLINLYPSLQKPRK